MQEHWKDIQGYEGFYQASDLGRIKSLARLDANGHRIQERIRLLGTYGSYGHLHVQLYKDGQGKYRKVHHLILQTFIGPCPPGMECRHVDGITKNNRLGNLAWGTAAENANDKRRHGTIAKGSKHGMAQLEESKVLEIRQLHTTGQLTQSQLANRFGMSKQTINDIVHRHTWRHI